MTWNKLITSGSDASLNSLNVDNDVTVNGEFFGKRGYEVITPASPNVIIDFSDNTNVLYNITQNTTFTGTGLIPGAQKVVTFINQSPTDTYDINMPTNWHFYDRRRTTLFSLAHYQFDFFALNDQDIGLKITPGYMIHFNAPYLYQDGLLKDFWTDGFTQNALLPVNLSTRTISIAAAAAGETSEVTTVTDVLVDLTDWNSISIDWENIGTATIENISALRVSTIKNGDQSTFDAGVQLTNVFARQTSTVDVSGLTGNYYVRVHARDNSTNKTPARSRINVFGIRLNA